MVYSSIVNADVVSQYLEDRNWRVIDCRFNLKIPEEGHALYTIAHIPNAIYAHLNDDLSSPVTMSSGRHPLPEVDKITQTLSRWGVDRNTQVIVYDNAAGSYAARLWWLLRWLGHTKVAVLNGGLDIWKRQGLPLSSDQPEFSPAKFSGSPDTGMIASTGEIEKNLHDPQFLLIDVRDPIRYQGLQEPIDSVAGHIPGAINVPWKTNIDKDGLYLPKAQLFERYTHLLHGNSAENTVFMCGSGVTACHSLVALEYLDMKGARLYPGSWSQWVSDPKHPVQTTPI